MDRAIVDLPTRFFGLSTFDWHLDVRGRSAGDGVTGNGQVVYGSMPRWTCAIDLRALYRRPKVRAWRTVLHRVRGRINVLRVQVNDPMRPLARETGLSSGDLGLIGDGLIPHDDESLFSDGSGYTQSPAAPLVADAAAGATSLSFDGGYVANAIEGGVWFSLGGWLYLATGIEGTGTDAVLSFEPPLREAANAGDELDFAPWAYMVLADDLQGRLPLQAGFRAESSLTLVEWTNRG